jgi:glycosyltransferase involved in cell wall biosynthesis
MKIVHIVPGSGGTFYCQNCMRDGALVQAQRKLGLDVVLVPMYLPMFADGNPVGDDTPVFFGGINVWLQQQLPFFRTTPRWLDRILDSKWMLKRAAKMEGTTSPAELGPMTLSMINGSEGNQKKEVERLIQWLVAHEKPDAIHISNVLLIGLVRELKERLDIPVFCSLQDEDWWLDEINPPFDKACWEAIQARTAHVDRFIAVSNWFAGRMSQRLMIARDLIDVVHVGIDLEGYEQAPLDFDPPVLGFLSRMNAALGLDKLVDAFIELKQFQGLENLQLHVMGGAVGADLKCVSRLRKKLARAGYSADVEIREDLSRESRLEFLKSLSVMCVPVEQGEAFGSHLIESMAAGVPVVQPNAGAFPELIIATGGGVIYDDIVQTLKRLLTNPGLSRELGKQGRKSVEENFSIETMAKKIISIYKEVI